MREGWRVEFLGTLSTIACVPILSLILVPSIGESLDLGLKVLGTHSAILPDFNITVSLPHTRRYYPYRNECLKKHKHLQQLPLGFSCILSPAPIPISPTAPRFHSPLTCADLLIPPRNWAQDPHLPTSEIKTKQAYQSSRAAI